MNILCGAGVPPWRAITAAALGAVAFFVVGAGAATGDISCGATITQDTKLEHDLVDCPGDGIVIGADGITLDLNGHTIDGDGSCCGSGVLNRGPYPPGGYDGVTIMDGTIREFVIGISVEFAAGNVVRRISASEGVVGVDLYGAPESVVERSHISANGTGVSMHGSARSVVRGNSLFANRNGLYLIENYALNVERNRIADSAVRGIYLSGEFAGRLAENVLLRNALGIFAVDIGRMQIDGNEISRSSVALQLIEASYNEITRNSLTRNELGLEMGGDASVNQIAQNSIINNARSGISLPNGLGSASTDNRVVDNLLARNGEDGIFIGSEHDGTLVVGNEATGNGDDGLDVRNPTSTLTGNIANRNRDLGIEAAPGVIDGGGNRAKGNGNPLQCVNITCS